MVNPETTTESTRSSRHWGHLAVEASLGLLVAVIHIVLLRGANIGILVVFGLPMLFAFTCLHKSADNGARRIAFAFLLLIAIGGMIAPIPWIFPRMMHVDAGLPRYADRMLMWYEIVFSLFALNVVPLYTFSSCLLKHRRGEAAMFSPPTCGDRKSTRLNSSHSQ